MTLLKIAAAAAIKTQPHLNIYSPSPFKLFSHTPFYILFQHAQFFTIILINPTQTMIRLLLLLFLSPLSSKAANSPHCIQTCGNKRVQYPFGFSDGCSIKLNCTSGSIKIGSFSVNKVTQDQISVDLPAECNRPIDSLSTLFGDNFAPTWRNAFLLLNCSSVVKECRVPTKLAGYDEDSDSCFNARNNVSCSSFDGGGEFLNDGEILAKGNNCTGVFSSVSVGFPDDGGGRRQSSSVSMEFNKVEVGWWMNGNCSGCDREANCMVVDRVVGEPSYRCWCREGYAGDGFAAGEGCRRVYHCNAQKYMSGRCGRTKLAILIGGIIAGSIIFAALVFMCYCMRKRSRRMKRRDSGRHLLSETAGNYSIPLFSYREIERSTNGFAENQRLGTGAYGTVYAGKLPNFELVAIKKIRYRDHQSVEQVMNEIKLLSTVSHPNLVRLLGCCIENGQQILVYEYMPNGTLSQHLQRERGCTLPWTIRLSIAAETAHAIAHLHSAINPPIYHRDIKSSNILLDYIFNSKVADFGLSRIGMTDDSHISTAPQGTPGYVDPEYHQNFHLSDKSDVYSFGVVLVEIITAMKAVDFSRPHSEINLAALAVGRIGRGCVEEIIDPYLEPNRDAWTLLSIQKVAELAFRCLAFQGDMRPSMMEVADELDQIRLSAWAPMEENKYMKSLSNTKKVLSGINSRKLVVPQRVSDILSKRDEERETSPVSVQDPWLSEQSSPSANSLLGNIVQ